MGFCRPNFQESVPLSLLPFQPSETSLLWSSLFGKACPFPSSQDTYCDRARSAHGKDPNSHYSSSQPIDVSPPSPVPTHPPHLRQSALSGSTPARNTPYQLMLASSDCQSASSLVLALPCRLHKAGSSLRPRKFPQRGAGHSVELPAPSLSSNNSPQDHIPFLSGMYRGCSTPSP